MRHERAWGCVLGGLLAVGLAGGQSPAPEPGLDKATLAEVRKLQEKRRDALREALEVRLKLYQASRDTLDGVIKTSERLLAAELDLAKTDAERIAAHQVRCKMASAWYELAKAKHESGRGTVADTLEARAVVLEAEIGLLKAGGKPKGAKE